MQRNGVQTGPDAPTLQLVPAGAPLARLRDVSKRFGQIEALKDFNLQLCSGEVLALLGPEGAGKTTVFRILLGQCYPDKGEAQLLGSDPAFPESRQAIGVTLQEIDFPATLRVSEVIDLVGAHYLAPLPSAHLLKQFGLQGLEHRQIGHLSGGQQRRLAVALAFVGDPRVVFLDEPTAGLDAESRHEIWRAVQAYAQQNGTVLLATQSLEETEALATRVVLIDHGQTITEDNVAAIKARVGLKQVRFKGQALPNLPSIVRARQEYGRYSVYTSDADDLVRSLVRQGVAFESLEVVPVSLQEALRVISGGAA
jgi:ABC-2 type transport system ATP-binding protein